MSYYFTNARPNTQYSLLNTQYSNYAIVISGARYTSCIAFNRWIPSFIGFWNDFRPDISPLLPRDLKRLLIHHRN
jgi:hypothetical protein